MTAIIRVNDQYQKQFEMFIQSLPQGAVTLSPVKKSLGDELEKRVESYRDGSMKTIPFNEGLNSFREKIVNKYDIKEV
ncbi:MAG: Unknown protein [uncultured Sulfurovum sp.]|uniref:Uncharacterized protein n=1 Tax=uncultured Sulfurovum sp. TaxID=269237 RepID=A0A6S6S628_9BACT|nr:MAG: Unknown protein [uncultured Sulfurovum sp.]